MTSVGQSPQLSSSSSSSTMPPSRSPANGSRGNSGPIFEAQNRSSGGGKQALPRPGSGRSSGKASPLSHSDPMHRSPGMKREAPSSVMRKSGPERSPSMFRESAFLNGDELPDDEIFYVTAETPILIATQTPQGIVGLLTNLKNGEKGQAMFYHSDVRNSGEEIMEIEKVNASDDTRIRDGELVYIRAEGHDEESYNYLKGQSLSHKCTWGRHKDSSTKSQFYVRIRTNHGKGFLTEVDDFELVSRHWPEKRLGLELLPGAETRDQCGMAVLVKAGTRGVASMLFRAMETALEDRTLGLPPPPKQAPFPHFVPLSLPGQGLQVKGPAMASNGGAGGGERMRDCPYCGMLFPSNQEFIVHLETIHTRPSAAPLALSPARAPSAPSTSSSPPPAAPSQAADGGAVSRGSGGVTEL